MKDNRWILCFPVISGLWLLVTVVWAGSVYPGYSHVSQFISELGAFGTLNGPKVNILGLIPTSILMIVFVGFAWSDLDKRSEGATLYKWGLIGIALYAGTLTIAAAYPCDFGCRPESPSTSQIIHNLFGLSGYFFGVLASYLLAFSIRKSHGNGIFACFIIISLIATWAMLSIDPNVSWVGVAQRILEVAIYVSIIGTSYFKLARSNLLSNKI